MPLSHENLKVYQASIQFIAWTQPFIEKMPARISARDQLENIVKMIVGLRKRFGTVLNEEMAEFGSLTDHDHDQDHDY